MMDFLKTKFDSLCLVLLIVLLIGVLMWFQDKSDDKVVAWMEQTITTVLGAYIGLTQGHRLPWTKNGSGGTNGTSKPPDTAPTNVVPGAVLPTFPKQ